MSDPIIQQCLNGIQRLYRRVLLIVGRGRVGTVDDTGPVQRIQIVQLSPLETRDNTPRLSEYGFASNPLPGADVIVVFVGGDRSNGVIIATGDQRYRLHLAGGEAALHDDQGQKVWMKRDGVRTYSPLSVMQDCHGYGQKITWTGGTSWHIDNYTIGATVTSSDHPIAPPEIP